MKNKGEKAHILKKIRHGQDAGEEKIGWLFAVRLILSRNTDRSKRGHKTDRQRYRS